MHNSQWITLLIQSCLFLYSFGANLLHSFIMWLIDSFLSLHITTYLYLLFGCVLAIFSHESQLMIFRWRLNDHLQDSSNYSSWSWQYYSLYGFDYFPWSPIHPVSFPNFWELFQTHLLQFLSSSPTCSTAYSSL